MKKIGVIGLGNHGLSHIEDLAKQPHCEIAALADLNRDRLWAVQSRFAPDAFATTRWQDVVQAGRVDGVYITTPDPLHVEQFAKAVEAGIHAIIERPAATNWDEYRRFKQSLDQSVQRGLIAMYCQPRRFDPPFLHLKEIVHGERDPATLFPPTSMQYGDIRMLKFNLNYVQPTSFGKHLTVDTTTQLLGFSGLQHITLLRDSDKGFMVTALRDDDIELYFQGHRVSEEKGYREAWQVRLGKTTLSLETESGSIQCNNDTASAYAWPIDGQGNLLFQTDYSTRFKGMDSHFIEALYHQDPKRVYISKEEMLLGALTSLAIQDATLFEKVSLPQL